MHPSLNFVGLNSLFYRMVMFCLSCSGSSAYLHICMVGATNHSPE